MKAMLYNEAGGPEVLQYSDVADPDEQPETIPPGARVGA